MKKLKTIPNTNTYKQESNIDNDLILFVCNCLENVIDLHAGLDKKELAIDILSSIFKINEVEKNIINNTIQFLFDNNLIERIPFLTRSYYKFKNWIKRKFF